VDDDSLPWPISASDCGACGLVLRFARTRGSPIVPEQLCLEGADIILNPSASHLPFGKLSAEALVLEGSRAF